MFTIKPACTVVLFSLMCLTSLPICAADNKPVLLYSRYFNAQGENRYTAEGTYSDILKILAETFIVRVHDESLTLETLQDVAMVLVANPSDKAVGNNLPPPHCSAADVVTLVTYVENGGGFIVMGNQENHNFETKDMNVLLDKFGLQFIDKYTDAKQLVIAESAPIIGGKTWAYYTGDLIEVRHDHPAKPQAVVVNDLNQKPLGGSRDEAGALLAMATPGKGRVLVISDSGWIINNALSGKGIGKVAIKEHDNAEICIRLFRWAAGLP